MRWFLALFFFGAGVLAVAAFVDACDTAGTAHDRAIVGASLSSGGLACVVLWGRLAGRN